MTKATRKDLMTQIDKMDALLRGEAIEGLKIGATGITEEWVRSHRTEIAKILNS